MTKIETDPATNFNVAAPLLALGIAMLVGAYFVASWELAPIVRALEGVPVPYRGGQATWSKILHAHGLMLWAQCHLDGRCARDLRLNLSPVGGYTLTGLGALLLLAGFAVISMLQPARDKIADNKWLTMDIDRYPELTDFTVGRHDAGGVLSDPVQVHIGRVIEPLSAPSGRRDTSPPRFNTRRLEPIGLTDSMLDEHMVIIGPTGTGKTSRVLMRMLWAFARAGNCVVLPDFKYPEVPGLYESVSLFKRIGRPVHAILPYDRHSLRIPLFDSIRSYDDGLRLAEMLMPLDEFHKAAGEFYTLAQQELLGSIFKSVADSDVPSTRNMKEVLRITRKDSEEIAAWGEMQAEAMTRQNIRTMIRDAKGNYAGFMQGIRNALRVFEDDRVSRTFSSHPGQNFDAEAFLRGGGLLYLGIEPEHRNKRGETLTSLLDFWLDAEIIKLRTNVFGGRFPHKVRKVYDEAPSLGRLRNVLRNSATYRQFGISLIFGLQNEEQMEVVYGKDIWSAITQNMATQLILPTGLKGQAAIELSRNLGEREIMVPVESDSRKAGGVLAGPPDARRGRSLQVQKVQLVSASAVETWPYFLGILITKGTLPPALLAMLPVHTATSKHHGLDGKTFTVDNLAEHAEYEDLMEDLSFEERHAELRAFIGMQSTPAKQADERLIDTMEDMFTDWLREALMAGVGVRASGKLFEFDYRSLPAELTKPEQLHSFAENGWVQLPAEQEDSPENWAWLRISPSGVKVLGKFGERELRNVRYTGAYIRKVAQLELYAPDMPAQAGTVMLEANAAMAETENLVRRDPGGEELSDDEVRVAARRVMLAYRSDEVDGTKVVVIKTNTPFQQVIQTAIEHVKGLREGVNLTEDALPRKPGWQPKVQLDKAPVGDDGVTAPPSGTDTSDSQKRERGRKGRFVKGAPGPEQIGEEVMGPAQDGQTQETGINVAVKDTPPDSDEDPEEYASL